MKYMGQIGIILTISFIGEILNYIIPVQIPACIYGLIIMFVCLYTKIIKIDSVKETATFLIEIMPVMFIPAAVGLMNSWGVLKGVIIPIAIITVVSTIVTMIVTGHATQKVISMCECNEYKETDKKINK